MMGAARQFKLNESTALIRTIDASYEAIAMAERLGIAGQVEVTVGRWNERGQVIGFTKKARFVKGQACDNLLVEVFISDLGGQIRELDRHAREMQALIDENASLKARLGDVP